MIATDIKIAVKALRATKIRTTLTIVGIIIGVASVTMVLALGEGARQYIAKQAGTQGLDSLTIRSGKTERDLNGNVLSYNFLAALGSSTLSQGDLTAIQQSPHVVAAPVMSIIGTVGTSANSPSHNVDGIIATTPDLASVLNFKIRTGEFVDNTVNSNTAVVGFNLAEQLLGSDTAVGQNIYIRGQPFTVIGILAPYSVPANFDNPFNFNNSVFIPLSAGQVFNQGAAQIQQIDVRVADNFSVKTASETLHRAVLANHGGQEDFTILQPGDTVQITDNLLHVLTLLVTAIASISLLVGGIGIMNIMLVSVTERTREIGIRKTVGATNGQILRQFIIEALIMSLSGGLTGMLIAYASAFGIGMFVGFMPVITLATAALAIGMAVGTGIIFGIAPAIIAARKNPIEALRFFQ
ncbi:MAG TPA: ABC transporter permease [Candidatus Acidoferrum sp.]|nr:ABC transporter permease [Candidatus Acidoferrum sp.]